MNTESEILKAMLGPEALEEFFSDYWPDRIFVAHGDRERLPVVIPAHHERRAHTGAGLLKVYWFPKLKEADVDA